MVYETDLRGCSDGDVVMLFRITQLVMEYLLHTQDQLLSGLSTLANKYNNKKNEINEKKKLLVTLQESCKHLKQENKIKMNSDDEGCEESVNLSAREDEEDESEAPTQTAKK
jgi:hypothetical protein